MSERFCLNDPASVSRFRDLSGAIFSCSCGEESFSLWEIHNPYGHDMCPQHLRCSQCGAEWESGYSGFPRLKRIMEEK